MITITLTEWAWMKELGVDAYDANGEPMCNFQPVRLVHSRPCQMCDRPIRRGVLCDRCDEEICILNQAEVRP